MNNYAWAVNRNKLNRAIAKSISKDEEDIKSIYRSLAGKIKFIPKLPEMTMTTTDPIKKRGRPRKNA